MPNRQSVDGGVAEGLAAVPHHRAQEAQVGRRERPAEQRQLGGAREAVGIVHLDELELGVRREPACRRGSGPCRAACCTPSRAPRRVETSASGELAPSLRRKIGSVPCVRSKRSRTPCGRDRPALLRPGGSVTQLRPLLPSSRKKGLRRSMKPLVLIVTATPLSLRARASAAGRAGADRRRPPGPGRAGSTPRSSTSPRSARLLDSPSCSPWRAGRTDPPSKQSAKRESKPPCRGASSLARGRKR